MANHSPGVFLKEGAQRLQALGDRNQGFIAQIVSRAGKVVPVLGGELPGDEAGHERLVAAPADLANYLHSGPEEISKGHGDLTLDRWLPARGENAVQ